MKRFLILTCMLLACNLLYAEGLSKKDKVFFEKDYRVSILGFYESSDLEMTNGYKYYIQTYDFISNEERVCYEVLCNDYETIKNFFYKIREKGLGHEEPCFNVYINAYLTLADYADFTPKNVETIKIKEVYHNKDFIPGKKNMIHDFHVCILE